MAYLIGIVVALVVILLCLKSSHPRAGSRTVIATACVGVLAGLGAKLYSVIERGGVLHGLGWEMSAGYRYPGAMMAVLLGLPVLWRLLRPEVSMARFLDAGVLGVCAGMVVVRIGCFISGCCHGAVSDVLWATRYGVDSAPWHAHRTAGLISPAAEWSAAGHPLQIYFLAAIAAIGLFLVWFRKHRQTYDGQLALIFIVLNGLSKGALESLRFSYVPSLQVYSLAMAAIAAVGLVVMRSNSRDGTRG